MITPLLLRIQLKAYNADLLARLRRVACPRCGAKRGKRCTHRGRERASCCWARHHEAKRVGHVMGRRL